MVEDILEFARNQIKRAEEDLEKAKVLCEKLRKAGENVADLTAKIHELETKLERYKKAFE